MVSFLLVLGHDVEAEPLVDGVRDALDARLDLERLVGEHLRENPYMTSNLGHPNLGCRFPVSSADFWLCLRKFCGEADRGRLAGQRREFKTRRKSTAQLRTDDRRCTHVQN